MTPHERALEAAARAMIEATSGPFEMLDETGKEAARFEARAAVTAYLAEAGDGWRDIETAPEGIAEVLLYSRRKNMVWIGYRTEHVKTGEVGWVLSQLTGETVFCPWQPTHWRPLPKAPEGTSND